MSKKLSFNVKGTSCGSCEVLIERELKEIPGVHAVKVSHPKGTVLLTVDEEVELSGIDLEKVLTGHEYRFLEEVEKEGWSASVFKRIGASLVVIVGLYIVLKQIGVLNFSPETEGISSYGSIFMIGLVAAFSSCSAVVAGLIVAVSTKANKSKVVLKRAEKMLPHLLFHAGRLLGFAGFGAMVGFIGQAFTLNPSLNAVLVIVLALFMIMIGVNLLGVLPRGLRVITPPKWLAHKIHNLVHSERKAVPVTLGALTFFLPCGFTQSMQLFALSTGDPRLASLVMLTFALGTAPVLLGLSYGATSVKGQSLKRFTQMAGAFVVVLGISNITNGATLLGFSGLQFVDAKQVITGNQIIEGEQVIKMAVTSRGTYEPDFLTVTEGIPVRWEIEGADFMGCADSLILRAFGVNVNLETGKNIVNFTPTKTGRYTFSCSMGMVRGTMNVISQK
ncbi:hypothetical protein CO173_00290 [Candidatus Uhrbacteria bacterium CG_4_9_14_3_um_filter_41_35]|uniref:HMA domain-containing protein n=1 Tax=Candidatus Uhrbacteria bacterium CG_4_9_14_3_um_filter_41_35 TaxID=1975034 RepID=A0A2M7XGT4_9BACT|nr:MAG: hypothetical protein COV92_00495 [Candidatus Uhrbacteria bacterium CG11_big_fil_rev_8_21_14_0_20_41_9]PJA47088.1 MAG: hypothetical protein CO173_00290 [Candidatus Uhrbacteria bacterium CG_4_9_14_3_um_filter_41_35]